MRTLPQIALLPGFTPGEPKTYTVRGYEQGVLRAGGFPVTLPLTDRPEILSRRHISSTVFFLWGARISIPGTTGRRYWKPAD